MKAISAVAILALQAGFAASSLAIHAAAQNPLAALENEAKEKAAEAALTKILNDNLPLTLNAKDVFPTVTTLPGGPFSPTPLKITALQLNQPLPPGDYTINTLDFCSQYSVHQPGAGLAYVLGPYEGKAAEAIGQLIWRGTEQYHINPNSLQAVSWAIQSGLTYDQMPKSYQAIIDQVIPDLKSEISGDFVANLENTYNSLAKAASLPPLDAILAKLGDAGKLALDAERQRQILTAQNASDELKEQTLFQGQESGIYTPVKAENGPWTERVKGQVYMKLLIAGGNMATNNVMQIRIMPSPMTHARVQAHGPHLLRTAYGYGQTETPPSSSGISIGTLLEGILGYSQGQGAQALGQVAVTQGPAVPPPTVVAGQLRSLSGNVNVIRAGTTTAVPLKFGDEIDMGDTIETESGSTADIVFADNTEMKLGDNTKVSIDDYVFNPNGDQSNHAQYRLLEGAFQYVSGLIGHKEDSDIRIHTEVGCIGIRGTELVAKIDVASKSLTTYLIAGAVAPGATTEAVHTAPAVNAPLEIVISPSGVKTSPLTQDQYNAVKAQIGLSPTS